MRDLTRRQLLECAGACVALPLLPSLGHAKPTQRIPKRLIFMNYGFGLSHEFYPDVTQSGPTWQLTDAMAPLAKHRSRFSFLSNLTNVAGTRYNPHHGATTFLTSIDPARTPGREFHNAISCDQIAARHIGATTRYASLELTTQESPSGRGRGLSLAWDEAGRSLYGEADPMKVFHRLFATKNASVKTTRARIHHEKSVLDAVMSDAKRLASKMTAEDRQKTDEYFDLVRKIETGLTREDQWLDRPKSPALFAEPEQNLNGLAGANMMFDLITAAFQTDATRVVTYQLPLASLLQEFNQANNTRVSPHGMTHYGSKDMDAYRALAWRDQKLCELFSTLMDKLDQVTEADGTSLLDNTLIVMGSDIRTGHGRKNVAITFAGGDAMGIQHGQHHVFKESESKLSDLWLTMLKTVGCPIESFADSDGVIPALFG